MNGAAQLLKLPLHEICLNFRLSAFSSFSSAQSSARKVLCIAINSDTICAVLCCVDVSQTRIGKKRAGRVQQQQQQKKSHS
jgi:hypothetical protein